jgi:DNA-binding beta-propeller fold protein YncE
MKALKVGVGLLALVSGVYLFGAAGGYHLVKKIALESAPGSGQYFDYILVDNPARRVYLSHGVDMKVLDADSYAVVGTITGFKRNHGVALVPDLGKGFITDGEAEKVIVFDMKTFKTTGEIKADKDTDYIMYEPVSKRVFAFNGSAHNITVIDPAKESVIGTIPLSGVPEQAVADGKGMIYDNIETSNEVVAIDSKTLQIKAHYPVAPCGQPVSMAMDREHRRLFIGCRGPKLLVVMNADTGKLIGEPFPIGDRVDTNVFDTATGLLLAATREGTIHVYHEDSPDKFSVVETVKTEFGAKTMGLDPKTHRVWVTTSDFGPAPAKTEKQPNPQPVAKPGTFRALVYGPK